jgi:hypothetical protein
MRMKTACLVILLGWHISAAASAAAGDLSIGGQLGVSGTAFANSYSFSPTASRNSTLTLGQLGLSWGLRGRWSLGDHHAVRLDLSRMTNTARRTTSGRISSQENLRLANALLTASYSYQFKGAHSSATPYLGVGPTLVWSRLTSIGFSSTQAHASGLPTQEWLVGFVGYLGERASISRTLSMSAELQARWTQRAQLQAAGRAIPVDLTGIGFGVGFDWAF